MQAQSEMEQGLPYAPFMAKNTELALANLQINFINYVVNPIWSLMHQVFPEVESGIQRMADNKASWEQKKDQLLAKENKD